MLKKISKSVFIIGHCGFLGSAIAQKLEQLGFEVHGELIVDGKSVRKLCDLCKPASILKLLDFEIIIHSAGITHPRSDDLTFDRSCQDVVKPSIRLFESLKHHNYKGKITYISSAGALCPLNVENFDERSVVFPRGKYGFEKYCLEQSLISLSGLGLDTLILRPSNPYGEFHRDPVGQGIIGTALNARRCDISLEVFAHPETARDFIFIDDFAYVSAKLINTATGIFNVSSNQMHSIKNVITLLEHHGVNCIWNNKSDAKLDRIPVDNKKLFEHIGAHKFTTLEVGLARLFMTGC